MKLLFFDSYSATIKNSVGSKIFQNLFVEIDGEKKDILEEGKISCGLHTSGILFLFDLIKTKHATVSGTVKDMKNFGWKQIDEPRPGCVIYWEEWDQGGTPSEHIGFYVGNDEAISNDWQAGVPKKHHWTYGGKRGVKAMYWHSDLEKKYF